MMVNNLVGDWPTPLKIWVSQLGLFFPTEWKNMEKSEVPNHQPEIYMDKPCKKHYLQSTVQEMDGYLISTVPSGNLT